MIDFRKVTVSSTVDIYELGRRILLIVVLLVSSLRGGHGFPVKTSRFRASCIPQCSLLLFQSEAASS